MKFIVIPTQKLEIAFCNKVDRECKSVCHGNNLSVIINDKEIVVRPK